MPSKFKQQNKKIAKEKIIEFFKKAESSFKKDKEQANDYVRKARRIAMKHKIKLGGLKRKFCKYCYCFLKPGVNCRIRTNQGKVVIYCLECKRHTRIPYK